MSSVPVIFYTTEAMDRRRQLLSAIIKEFIETAEPVGSQTIVVGYKFEVSPATIRNDMAELEDQGFLFQPHTSAGRIPTDLGYRLYVDELADYTDAQREAEKVFNAVLAQQRANKAREKIYDAVSLLAQATGNASFATLPDNRRTFYLGFSNVLKQPEFSRDPFQASQVMEVLEDTDHFVNTLSSLELDDDARIFIGKENILPQIQSCAVIVCRYSLDGFNGFLGLLGPTRMAYPFNHVMLKKVRELLQD